MASAVFMSTRVPTVGFPSMPGLLRGFVNALIASRMASAERELRRHGFVHEAALIHGEFRKIGLRQAEMLPFNG